MLTGITCLIVALLFFPALRVWRSGRGRNQGEENDPPAVDAQTLFPTGLHDCRRCPYYHQAQADPEHALSVCPECGLSLLPKEPLP